MPEVQKNIDNVDAAGELIPQSFVGSYKVRFFGIIGRGTDGELVEFLTKYRNDHI